ncbi:MAG: type I methionyl aminopeptidase [Cytophagales bacterium]|nr:MAG: type I methionyl aminopeptidase [Cytophagales bacterium]TAF62458.1 MAG: type I methionyl aminopeptidase [Cytophagales bacterium]
MIYYKSEQDIEAIRLSAQILGKAHGEVAKLIEPGATTKALDKRATEFIFDHKASPSFLNYKVSGRAFPAALCISVNDVVVHGIPSDYVLREGDIISVDCGVYFNGFHSDSAYTYPIGQVKPEVTALLKATKESLCLGIEQVRQGNRIGDIGAAIQQHTEKLGFGVVRELVGHGLGKNLHEEPQVPNHGKKGNGPLIRNGLVIAIEPMINLGRKEVFQAKDGWTIKTKDGKPSAHFEHTVAVVNGYAEILTTFKYIEEVLSIA